MRKSDNPCTSKFDVLHTAFGELGEYGFTEHVFVSDINTIYMI